MPRASLLLICAFNTARMCRVSTQISSFQSNPLEAGGGVLQHCQQRCRLARYLHFTNDLGRVIHNTDARVLDRNVQSSKMLHAALLLLMLEAVTTDLVSTSA